MDTSYIAVFLENPVDLDRAHSILRGCMSKSQLNAMTLEVLPSRAMNGVVLRLVPHGADAKDARRELDPWGTGLHRGGLNFILTQLAARQKRAAFAILGGDGMLPAARGVDPDGKLMWRDIDDGSPREHLDELAAQALDPDVDDETLLRLERRAAAVIGCASFGRMAGELGWDRFLFDDDAVPLDCVFSTSALLKDARPRWQRAPLAGAPVLLVPREVLREAALVRELVDSDVLTVATREGLAGDRGFDVQPWRPGWLSTLIEAADLALDRDEYVSLLEMAEFQAVEPGALVAALWSDFVDELASTTPALADWLALPDAERPQLRRMRERARRERRGREHRDNVVRANEELAVLRAEAAQFGLDPDHLDDDDLR